MIYNGALDLIGKTPIMKINNMVDKDCADVYVKLEKFNPGGSAKDRAALGMVEEAEKQELIRELLSPNLNAMFVTPKDIDESVKRLSYTISEGINMAFFPA